MPTKEERIKNLIEKGWKQIDEKGGILIFYKTTKFNNHPDSPNLHHYAFLNENNMWRNYVCFESDDEYEIKKTLYLWQYYLEVMDHQDWKKNIQELKDKKIIEEKAYEEKSYEEQS